MVPLRQPRHEDPLEIRQDALERLALLRSGGRETLANRSGPDARQDGVPERPLEIIGEPLHEPMALFAELLRRHISGRARFHDDGASVRVINVSRGQDYTPGRGTG